ncbi:MAG: sugar ABC transporter ATP-binding protein [Planctomycetota bacterium]
MSSDPPLLRAQGVSKRFGSTQALLDVSVEFAAGEVHALMGENGAGKSTLGKAIAGIHKIDEGVIELEGEPLRTGSLDDTFARGVRIVHQELAQCPNLSVAENLCLHDLPRNRLGLIDRGAMMDRAAALVHRMDPSIDARSPLGDLSPGRRQICQIAAALDEVGSTPKLIVFDEPTSSLAIAEAERLMEIVRELTGHGLAIVYVSHRMGEIFACCDRVTVLRDGKFVATSRVADIDEPTLVEQMIGRRVSTPTPKTRSPGGEAATLRSMANGNGDGPKDHTQDETLLAVRSISSPRGLDDISLEVHAGEVLGVGGLVGAGRSELLDAIFGVDPAASGAIRVGGDDMPTGNRRAMIRSGVGYVPEDRRRQGLFFQLGVGENILVPFMPRLSRGGVRAMGAERELVDRRVRSFQIKTATTSSTPDELSGGNQQKLLIARWMGRDTKVLLLDEPTRGIDVGTKAEIYKQIREAASRGLAVLLVSSEMPELLALSDRIVVLSEGRLAGELRGEDMTQTNILTLATRERGRDAG